MNSILFIDDLKNALQQGNNKIGKVNSIVPLTTSNEPPYKKIKELENHFHLLMGDFVRKICEVKITDFHYIPDELNFKSDQILEQITNEIEHSPLHEADLKRLFKLFLYSSGDQTNVNLFHPYMYLFLPEPDQSIFQKYAQFLLDIFVEPNSEIKSIFLDRKTDDLLSEIILNNLNDNLSNTSRQQTYQPLLDVMTKNYQSDLNFISKHKEFFLNNFGLLTHFYLFMYVCQLFVKFDAFENGNYAQLTPLTFALDWEALNKRRQAANEFHGFKRILNNCHRFFIHIYTMSYLSHNAICCKNQDRQKIRFYHYKELFDLFSNQPSKIKNQYLKDINEWAQIYCDIFKIDSVIEPAKNLEGAFRLLFNCVQKGVNMEAVKKFEKHIKFLAGNTFLKARGSIGLVLNMNHDMLILLTAVCVKSQRIPLNLLFQRFEERGVLFDRYSKQAIIQLFDSHNILDKKSDSGDAIYVKPIL